jgi:hypothetical protein
LWLLENRALVLCRGGDFRVEFIELFVEGGHGLFFTLGLVLSFELALLIRELGRDAGQLALLAR